MKKARISMIYLMVLCLIFSMTSMLAGAQTVSVYNGSPSTTLRSEGDTYFIDSAQDLAFFATSVTGGNTYSGKTVKLTTDIVWNEGNSDSWTISSTGLNKWESIGNAGKPFSGTFDGQGHSVSGLWGFSNTWGYGFFGSAANAVIKNFKIVNSSLFNVDQQSGGLVGRVNNGSLTIENCYMDLDFTQTVDKWYAGGLVGWTNSDVTIKNTVYAGKVVSASSYVGGFIGAVNNDAAKIQIIDSAMTGSVNSTVQFVGGFLGGNASTTASNLSMSVSNSLVSGTVSANNEYGAVISLKNIDRVAMTSTNLWVLDTSSKGSGAFSGEVKKTADEIAALTTESLSKSGFTSWVKTAEGIMPNSVATLRSLSAITTQPVVTEKPQTQAQTKPQTQAQTKAPVTVKTPMPNLVFDLSKASVYDGKVSEKLRVDEKDSKIIYIDSAQDLALFAQNVTAGTNYGGNTIVLTTDIVWNTGDADKWAEGKDIPKYIWSCGAWNKFFQGTFDGQGHVISGLYNSSDKDNLGFINGVGGTCTIKNVVVINSTIICTRTTGSANLGFVGVTGERCIFSLSNVYSDMNLISKGASNVGGIVGRVHNGLCEVNIENAVVAGTIIGGESVGGFIGTAAVNNNPDKLSTTLYIKNSINLATVTATKSASGFVGYNENGDTKLTNCINAGVINCDDTATVGALFGNGPVSATYSNCVYVEGTVTGVATSSNITGLKVVKSADILGDTATKTLSSLDFNKDWTTIKGAYPMPLSVNKFVASSIVIIPETTTTSPSTSPQTQDAPIVTFLFMALTSILVATIVHKKQRKHSSNS